MPADNPPSYDAASAQTGTDSQHLSVPASIGHHHGNRLERVRSNESATTASSDGFTSDLLDDDGRRSMSDEMRDLPPGWVRCWDDRTAHHFYVDEATKRSTWLHPYDDPEYLKTLPADHPAHPESNEAQEVRKMADAETIALRQKQQERSERHNQAKDKHESDRNWFQKKKDQLIGTKEEREKAKEERRRAKEEERRRIQVAEQEYLRRRKELIQKQLNDPNIRRYYASNPYQYAAPSMSYMRPGGMYGSPYGYGYGGGYGRRYGYGGYGGGMGMGMPLFGGMAGGLLLGSAMSGGFGGGYGGGFGGGGFGGDCGGGGGGDGGGGM